MVNNKHEIFKSQRRINLEKKSILLTYSISILVNLPFFLRRQVSL